MPWRCGAPECVPAPAGFCTGCVPTVSLGFVMPRELSCIFLDEVTVGSIPIFVLPPAYAADIGAINAELKAASRNVFIALSLVW
jgi:hypothetical protein